MKLQLYFAHLFLIFIFSSPVIFGQGLCNVGGGAFHLDKYEGCAPLRVAITNDASGASLVSYQANYNGSATNNIAFTDNLTSANYANPGTFTILQRIVTGSGAIAYACQKVKVFDTRPVVAQYSSCGGGKVRLSLVDDAVLQAYDRIEINWGDGETVNWQKGQDLVLEHNYSNVNTQPIVRITGLYNSGAACAGGRVRSDTVAFEQAQLNSIAIKSVDMRGDGSIRFTYQGLTAIPTTIEYSGDGTNYTVAGTRSSGGVQPYDIKELNKDQVYRIRLSSEDLCDSKLTTDPVATMTLSGKSEDGKIVLSWNKYSYDKGFEEYQLLREGTVIKTFTSINDITYTDESLECGTFAEYQLVAKVNGITSASAPIGLKAEVGTARIIETASVTVNGNNSVTISANIPGAGPGSTYDFSIEKAEAGSTVFRKITTVFNDNHYSDIDVKTNELSYCYKLSYKNSCGQSPEATQPICTILLKRDFINLSWTPEKPVLPEVTSYNLLQTGSGGSDKEVDVKLVNSYTPTFEAGGDLEYSFQIRADSRDDDFKSFSNVISINRNAEVFIPDAFSPNGDGINDVLEAKAMLLQSFSLSVFNRWGQVVFQSDEIEKGWDGTINGANAPVGSYVYKLKVVDVINQTVEKSGTFMLFR